MSSIGSDVKVGKLTVLEGVKFETDTSLDASQIVVNDRFEFGSNCNIVGLTETFATDAEVAAVESHLQGNVVATQSNVSDLQSGLNTANIRINGLVSSLSTTDASIVAVNSNLVSTVSDLSTEIANAAANTVSLRQDVSNLEANVIELADDISSNAGRVSVLEGNAVALAGDISSNSARITVVESELGNVSANVGLLQSNVSNLNFHMHSANGLVSNLSSNLSNIKSEFDTAWQLYSNAVAGNTQAESTLLAAGAGSAATIGVGGVLNVVGKIFGFAKQKANQAVLDQTRDTIAEVFGTTSNNWENITSSNGYSLTNNSNIMQLQNQMALVRSHTDTTSARQIKINANSSNINALQSNTAQLATAISIHSSNIGSLNQSIITIETDINSLTSSLSDNSSRITTVSGDLASNSARITTVTSDLASNVSRIQQLESAAGSSGTFSNLTVSGVFGPTASNTTQLDGLFEYGYDYHYLYPNGTAYGQGNNLTPYSRIHMKGNARQITASPASIYDKAHIMLSDTEFDEPHNENGTYGTDAQRLFLWTQWYSRQSVGAGGSFIQSARYNDHTDDHDFGATNGYMGRLCINPFGGDVGVGTDDPACKLDVNGAIQSKTGKTTRVVPVRFNGYNDVTIGAGNYLSVGNREPGAGTGYLNSFCHPHLKASISNHTGETNDFNRFTINFRWCFNGGYVGNVTFRIYRTVYYSGGQYNQEAQFTSGNSDPSRGFTTVMSPELTATNGGDVVGYVIEPRSTDTNATSVRINHIWLELRNA